MSGNITLRRTVAVLLTLIMLFAALFGLSQLVKRKASDIQYADFFKEKQNFDVLFLGTSRMMDAVYPMEMWQEHGFTSYNCGGHANALATTYWVAQMLLEYTTPKVMVIDCFDLTEEAKTSRNSFSYVHLSMDAFPLSRTKIRAVRDLLDDPEIERLIAEEKLINEDLGVSVQEEERKPITLLWPFSVYHNRWSSLGRSDFRPMPNLEKGAETTVGLSYPLEIDRIPPEEKLDEDTVSIAYLEKLIRDCQARGIEVLLLYLPSYASETEQREAHRLPDIAAEYGVECINFLDLDVVDVETDSYDDLHLNCSGAWKVSAFLGDYLAEHFELPDHREDPDYAAWQGDYKEYRAYRHSQLRGEDELIRYLLLLSDPNYEIEFSLGDGKLFTDARTRGLLENLGIRENDPLRRPDGADLEIVVRDRVTGETADTVRGVYELNTEGELTGVTLTHA